MTDTDFVRPELQPRETIEIAQEVEKPKPDELEQVYGVDQSAPFSTPWIENTWEILRDFEESAPTIRQLCGMRRVDGQAAGLYRLLTLPIRSALKTSTFVPDEGGEKEAEFADQMFNLPPNAGGMTVTFSDFMAHLLRALFDGFAAFEMVYWMPDKGPLKGKYTIQKLAYRPSDTITFLTNKNGNFEGLRQQTTFLGEVIDKKIPGEDCFYYSAQDELNPYYGVSYFQSAFYHYDKKLKLAYVMHLAAQRQAFSTRVGEYPPGTSKNDKGEFNKRLANLGMAQWMSYPVGYKVSNLTETGTFDFLSLINYHSSQMSKSILASFFDKEQGAGTGDAKLVDFGSQSSDFFVQMLEAIMEEIASKINNYIIPKFIDWNFSSGKYPKFKWGTFTDEKRKMINDTFDKLAVAGQSMTVTPDFMFEIEKKVADELGLELDYDEIKKRMDEEKAAQQAQQDAYFNQGDPNAQGDQAPDPMDDVPPLDGSAPAPASGPPPAGPPLPPGLKPPGGPSQKPVGLSMPLGVDDELARLAKSILLEYKG